MKAACYLANFGPLEENDFCQVEETPKVMVLLPGRILVGLASNLVIK